MKLYVWIILIIITVQCNNAILHPRKVWKSECNEDYTIVHSTVNSKNIIHFYGQKEFNNEVLYYKSIGKNVSVDESNLSFKLDSFLFSKESLKNNPEGTTFFKNEYRIQLPSSLDCKIDLEGNYLTAKIFMFLSYSSFDTCHFILLEEQGIPPQKPTD
ncbi:hypothetical protein [Aureispira sp. CCB-E]|uniref:hypothetical protein n=1 Tax=Aureispira sp. CCB-E TaxID=3051121 RepID=UPI002868DE09|nr:hypothetical protein [Aureispira sp. CCB-E]WMX16444.1 hypothetical protein QP953_08695 [Aureispira sp. CCB-E]